MSAKLGPNAIDVTLAEFRELLSKRKGAIKSLLLNQERIAGIGNAYVHDILFFARLHPLRTIDTLSDDEVEALWDGIQKGLKPALKKGGAFYERNLYGKRGGFKMKDIIVGYREGKPCPACGEKIVKIKTGGTSSFICPKCQPLKSKKKVAAKKKPTKRKPAKKAKPSVKKPAGKNTAGKKPAKKQAREEESRSEEACEEESNRTREEEVTHRDGEVLFEDRFDGNSTDRWPVPPVSLIEDPEHAGVLHLKAGDPSAGHWLGWAGDDTWRNYRLEVEVLPVGDESGFLGLDFHVQSDESGCCNLHFPAFPEDGKRLFEGCGRYDDGNTSWKLGPLSQRATTAVRGEWLRLRLDAGETVANLWVGDDPEPVFTIYDLPFVCGGIRLWRYYASAFFRNLRVTALSDVEPILDDVWGSVAGPGVIRDWSISRMLPQDFGADGPVAAARADDMGWRNAATDRRGVVNVVAVDPGEYLPEGRRVREGDHGVSGRDARAPFRLTYTDQLSMWLNECFRVHGRTQRVERPGQERCRRVGKAHARPVRTRATAGAGGERDTGEARGQRTDLRKRILGAGDLTRV